MEKFTTLIHGDEPVLIDFFSHKKYEDHCSSVLGEVKNVLGERIRIIMLGATDNEDFIKSQGLHLDTGSFSTLMLFRKGRLLWRERGLPEKIEIIKNIVYSLK